MAKYCKVNRENKNGVKSPSIQNTDNDQKQQENNFLTFSVDSLVDLSHRFVFANSILMHNFGTIGLTETWLTEHIPTESLFLSNYTVYRNDRNADNSGFSKHGAALVAVHENLNSKEVLVDNAGEDYLIILLSSTNQKVLIA